LKTSSNLLPFFLQYYIDLISLLSSSLHEQLPSKREKTSSTNKIWVKDRSLPTATPKITLNIYASSVVILKLSTIMRNNRGERGNPCLTPLKGLKNLEAKPLIVRKKYTKMTHPII